MIPEREKYAAADFTTRTLTEREKTVTAWLLEHSSMSPEEKIRFLDQLAQATVIRRCPCGCASVDFAIAGIEASREKGMVLLGDFVTADQEYGIFVFSRGDLLNGVEIYPLLNDQMPSELPEPKDWIPFNQ